MEDGVFRDSAARTNLIILSLIRLWYLLTQIGHATMKDDDNPTNVYQNYN
jgi:hypothetical protein